MRFSAQFLSLVLMASAASVGALPSANSSPLKLPSYTNPDVYDEYVAQACQKALEHGVDPDGPMPTDFIEDNGQTIRFEDGSNFSLWIVAQYYSPGLKLRQKRGVPDRRPGGQTGTTIITYAGTNCDGVAEWHYTLAYDEVSFAEKNGKPYQINHSLRMMGQYVDLDDRYEYISLRSWDMGNSQTYSTQIMELDGGGLGCATKLPGFTCVEIYLR
ncbi:hypothetical protein K440DRAFT_683807 [Wilcoxina mikolae CBS 423.85]|nr:hypothetical protein K440DRAFT_683807 [Wilcoxina mikolae CBS 423.85]